MFASRGEATLPCGVPVSVWLTSPSSITPAFSHLRIRRMTRRSPTRCSTKRINHSWLTASKNPAMSASNSFRRIENTFCRVFGLKELDRHVEHHHVRCGDASRRPCFEKRARCRISLGWAVRELVHEITARFLQIGFKHPPPSKTPITREQPASRLTPQSRVLAPRPPP